MGFHQLWFDARWLLADPTAKGAEFDTSMFTVGRPSDPPEGMSARVELEGEPTDISWTNTTIPVVTDAVASLIESISPGAVQWVPLQIEGHGQRLIMNVVAMVPDCIDEGRTDVLRYPDDDNERPGQYHQIIGLHLKADLDPPHDIFRIVGWHVPIIITDRLKAALEDHGFTGWLTELVSS